MLQINAQAINANEIENRFESVTGSTRSKRLLGMANIFAREQLRRTRRAVNGDSMKHKAKTLCRFEMLKITNMDETSVISKYSKQVIQKTVSAEMNFKFIKIKDRLNDHQLDPSQMDKDSMT